MCRKLERRGSLCWSERVGGQMARNSEDVQPNRAKGEIFLYCFFSTTLIWWGRTKDALPALQTWAKRIGWRSYASQRQGVLEPRHRLNSVTPIGMWRGKRQECVARRIDFRNCRSGTSPVCFEVGRHTGTGRLVAYDLWWEGFLRISTTWRAEGVCPYARRDVGNRRMVEE